MNIKEAVAQKLANCGEEIAARVATELVETTLKKRVQQVTQAMTEIDNLNREMGRLKEDVVTYDRSGTVVTASFTKERLKELNTARDRITRIEKAIAQGLNDENWDALTNLGGKKADTEVNS